MIELKPEGSGDGFAVVAQPLYVVQVWSGHREAAPEEHKQIGEFRTMQEAEEAFGAPDKDNWVHAYLWTPKG